MKDELVPIKDLSRDERLKHYISLPEFPTILFRHMANGGMLTDLANLWDVHYSDLHQYIYTDSSLKNLYDKASQARMEYFIDSLKRQLQAIASLDVRGVYDDHGCIKPVSEWPESLGLAVSSIEVFEEFKGKEYIGRTKRIKFWSKEKSIELLGKTLAMFVDKVELTASASLEELILKSYLGSGSED